MATLQRFARHCNLFLNKTKRCNCHVNLARRLASTGTGKDVTESSNKPELIDKSEEFQRLKEYFADTDLSKRKNWTSTGWSDTDPDLDTFHHTLSMMSVFSVMFVCCLFLVYYFPDFQLRDWAHREAYLDLDRRERKGQPAIDPYFIPPEKVQLPSEAELGNSEIII